MDKKININIDIKPKKWDNIHILKVKKGTTWKNKKQKQ